MVPTLALLPRPGLDAIVICGFPKIPHSAGQSLYRRRVAVVKSEYCAHIYARPGSSADLRTLTLSTLKTFGPLSLFSRHQTDFFIIRLPRDPECQIWREFYSGDPDQAVSAKIHEDFRNYRPTGEPVSSPSQGEFAVDPEAIDWGRYDAVIIQDLCLPERLLRRFPDVFWSYCIGETGSPSFKQSFRKPANGYHLYLNGSSRRWRVRPGLRNHVLEFPYILQDSRTHSLLGSKPWRARSGILLEVNTARAIPSEIRTHLEKIAPVAENIGTPSVRLDLVHSCRYFVQMVPKRLWGNSLNEAVAAGCLGLANPDSMPNNRSLLMPGLTPPDWDSMLSLLQSSEADPQRAELEYHQQQAISDWLLCDRPLLEWETRLENFRSGKIL